MDEKLIFNVNSILIWKRNTSILLFNLLHFFVPREGRGAAAPLDDPILKKTFTSTDIFQIFNKLYRRVRFKQKAMESEHIILPLVSFFMNAQNTLRSTVILSEITYNSEPSPPPMCLQNSKLPIFSLKP